LSLLLACSWFLTEAIMSGEEIFNMLTNQIRFKVQEANKLLTLLHSGLQPHHKLFGQTFVILRLGIRVLSMNLTFQRDYYLKCSVSPTLLF
jgi:hypothetical protein